ncbi:MAG: hypothetical protein ACOC2K_03075 [Bacteroidota bacterium]
MAKLLIALVFIFLALPQSLFSDATLKEIVTISADPVKLNEKYDYASTEFFLANKQNAGKFYSFELLEILDNELKGQNIDTDRLVIVAENSKGRKLVFTYNDLSGDIAPIKPVLLYGQVTGSIGDTIKVQDIEGQKGMVDLEEVIKETDIAVRKRIYLQLRSFPEAEKKRLFTHGTIIFPIDATPRRWIEGVRKMTVYEVQ